MQCVQQAQNLMVLRLLCVKNDLCLLHVKRGLTAKFIYDMVFGKMDIVQRYYDICRFFVF